MCSSVREPTQFVVGSYETVARPGVLPGGDVRSPIPRFIAPSGRTKRKIKHKTQARRGGARSRAGRRGRLSRVRTADALLRPGRCGLDGVQSGCVRPRFLIFSSSVVRLSPSSCAALFLFQCVCSRACRIATPCTRLPQRRRDSERGARRARNHGSTDTRAARVSDESLYECGYLTMLLRAAVSSPE